MGQSESTCFRELIGCEEFQAAKRSLLQSIESRLGGMTGPRGPRSRELAESSARATSGFVSDRGRDLFYPVLGSGVGRGPLVELADGSVKYDCITGIGIAFFGHAHPAFVSAAIDCAAADVMQGNLVPAEEAAETLALLIGASSPGTRLKHGWLTSCGTMANEIALKIVRQRKYPAASVFAFEGCFAGRSAAMQEITDNARYREGQPTYGEVSYLPHYSGREGLEASLRRTIETLRAGVTRYPGRFACVMAELVQGEGGFRTAPAEFFAAVFEEARKLGLAVFVDEIQTFGRTGELFAFQKLGLQSLVDVVTAAKMLQVGVCLFSEEFNPKPGLVAGTYMGSTLGLRCARLTIELLQEGGFLGPNGRIARLSERFAGGLEAIARRDSTLIGEVRAIGGMIAFQPLGGSQEDVKRALARMFDRGVIAFSCGHGPYLVRLLPPFGALDEGRIDEICGLIELALVDCAAERADGTRA